MSGWVPSCRRSSGMSSDEYTGDPMKKQPPITETEITRLRAIEAAARAYRAQENWIEDLANTPTPDSWGELRKVKGALDALLAEGLPKDSQGNPIHTCPHCEGKGRIWTGMDAMKWIPCPHCPAGEEFRRVLTKETQGSMEMEG